MQGIAFTDEVSLQDIADIAEAARKRLATQQPVPLSVGPAFVDPEAILLQVSPASAPWRNVGFRHRIPCVGHGQHVSSVRGKVQR